MKGAYLNGTACVARAYFPACARDDAHGKRVVQPKRVANGKHLLPNQQISRVAKFGGVKGWLQQDNASQASTLIWHVLPD